nr:MAG TPA: hypothetical protein [Caudoviricetes sp.]
MTNHAFYGILKPSKERRFDAMYEFEVLLKNGEHTFIWGYSFDDAKRRNPKTANEIETILFQEYID